MKRVIGMTLLALLALTLTAEAQGRRRPPPNAMAQAAPAPLVAGWTGLWIGGGAGYGSWSATQRDLTNAGVGLTGDYTSSGVGWLVTAGVGYDLQLFNYGLVGIFAEYDSSVIKGKMNNQVLFATADRTMSSAWYVGLRTGYIITPSTMLYINGGYTEARFSDGTYYFLPPPNVSPARVDGSTFSGYFAGIGAEVRLWSNWFTRLEYRYANYRNRTEQITTMAGLPIIKSDFQPLVQTVRAELLYKFNWGP